MKIGLLTIHHAYNFGAMLQSYATFRILTQLGHDVEFIDYDNPTFKSERKIFLPINCIGNILRNLRSLLHYRQLQHRIDKFEKFYEKFNVSDIKYDSDNIKYIQGYDVILTGSDQTFSLYLTNDPEDVRPYFQEGIKDVRKISYASSMGEKFHMLTGDDNLWIKRCLCDFDKLAVREIKSADYIEKLIGQRPTVVLDPTLLLDAAQWNNEIEEINKLEDDYIVFYTVLSAPWVIKYVNNFASKVGMRVIALHSRTRYEIQSKFHYREDLGPCEFLSLIKNAKYVITTSFHATVFSIIFNKQFASLQIGEGNRLKTLLGKLGLLSQLIDENSSANLDWDNQSSDYKSVMQSLVDEREKSICYLKTALQHEESKFIPNSI